MLALVVVPPTSKHTTFASPYIAGEIRAAERAEHRTRFQRVDRLGLADACDAAVGMADKQRPVPALLVFEDILGLEQRRGELAVHIGVDQ